MSESSDTQQKRGLMQGDQSSSGESLHAIERAPLRILKSANMPAVIVEMGYLSTAEQEKQLTGNEFQNALVQAMVEAVLSFRDYLESEHR